MILSLSLSLSNHRKELAHDSLDFISPPKVFSDTHLEELVTVDSDVTHRNMFY